MKTPVSTSPMRLASWVGVGCALAIAPFAVTTFLHVPRLPVSGCGLVGSIFWANRLRLLVFFVPFAVGMSISMVAERRLRRGFEGEQWQEPEVEMLRRRMNHPMWSIFVWLPIVAWLGYAFESSMVHGMPLFWATMVPAQTISRLKMMVRPKRVRDGILQDWRSFKPIQSEHWGESRQDSLSL